MLSPFDFVKDIEFTKHDLMKDDPEAEKNYVPFVINRALSYHMDCVMFANEMNQCPNLDKKMQYHYLLAVIRARRRQANKWAKPIVMDDLEVLSQAYGFSRRIGMLALPLLSEHELALLREQTDLGGLKKSK